MRPRRRLWRGNPAESPDQRLRRLQRLALAGDRAAAEQFARLQFTAGQVPEGAVCEECQGDPKVWASTSPRGKERWLCQSCYDYWRGYALLTRLYRSCGLNADWCVQAWHLGPGPGPNRWSGDYYILDDEGEPGNFILVRRRYEDEEGEDIVGGSEEVEEVSSGKVEKVLTDWKTIRRTLPPDLHS